MATRYVVEQAQGIPGWLTLLSPQVGGYGMSYPQLLGAVLRLDTQCEKGMPALRPLIRALRAMGEDLDRAALRGEFPTLLPLMLTSGNPYTPKELQTLHEFMKPYLELPPFDQGIEALLRVLPTDPVALVGDWSVLSCEVRPGRTHRYTSKPPPYIVDDSNIGDLILTENLHYRSVHETLMEVGRWLHKPPPPRLWLLWENSD